MRRIAFLKHNYCQGPYHLSNENDLNPIVSYYQKKCNIKIYIAGDAKTNSPHYQAAVKSRHDLSQIFTNLVDLYLYRWNKPQLNIMFKDEMEYKLKEAGYINENGWLRKIGSDEIEAFGSKLISILQEKKNIINQ